MAEIVNNRSMKWQRLQYFPGTGIGADGSRVTGSQAHIDLSREAAAEGMVLLKNDGLLPLCAEGQTIGVIGPNANSRRALIGNYHGTSDRYITVLEGIQDYVGDGSRVLYAQGCDLFRNRDEPLAEADDRMAEALTVAECSDVVVLVLGLDETLEGEQPDEGNTDGSDDKRSLLLPESQRKLMDRILALGKKTVVLLMAGSAIDMSAAEDKANALLCTWYPGARGGKAVAELLFGKVSPSGKLPVTFYRNEALGEMPDFTDYSMRERTYRYYTGKPLYKFGFGLTYGITAVKSLRVEGLTATVEVENSGSADTEDVVQIYCKDELSPDAPVNPVLCGFKRVFLRAGENGQNLPGLVHLPGKCAHRLRKRDRRSVLRGQRRDPAGIPDADLPDRKLPEQKP